MPSIFGQSSALGPHIFHNPPLLTLFLQHGPLLNGSAQFFSCNQMMRNVHFYSEVSRALFKKRKKTRDCLERIPSTNLVDEGEVTSRCSEFQRMVRVQKQQLHERHLQRKKCRLPMRKDIIPAKFDTSCWMSKLGMHLITPISGHKFKVLVGWKRWWEIFRPIIWL